jgi:hypothetical protein
VSAPPQHGGARIIVLLRRAMLCSVLLGAAVSVASAQDPLDAGSASMGITTDRPAIADSSAVVPRGVFQAEDGLLDSGSQPHPTLDLPETLIRVGMTPSTELRFTVPDYYYHLFTPAGLRSGFGDLMVGIKQQLLTGSDGVELAATLSLSFPTGTAAISSHGYDPSFQLPWSRQLSTNWSAAGMLSVYAPTQNGSHQVVGEFTVLVDRQFAKAWDGFIEYAGDFSDVGGPRHLLHFGTSYKIASQQQLDVHVGVGLSAAAVDNFVGFGYSFRFRLARP